MKNKFVIPLVVIVFVLIIGGILIFISPSKEKQGVPAEGETEHTMVMKRDGYEPHRINIQVGDTITFINQSEVDLWPASNIHPTHEIYPEFDPQRPILPGESWSFQFNREGVWPYHDHLYPQTGGIIIIEPRE